MRKMQMQIMKILAVAGLTLIATLGAWAFNPNATATADATAAVEVLKPAAIINLTGTGLNFGQIVATTNGTVTVTPDANRTATGVTVVNASPFNPSQFQVSANPNSTFSITLPGAITISSGSNNMTVDTFTSDPSGTGTLDVNGLATINVGATLHVAANQPVGHYNGTFSLIVAYN